MAEAIAGGLVYLGVSAATAASVAAVATTVAVGIAVGAVVGAGVALVSGGDVLSGALKGALIGGVSAGVFSAASSAVSAIAEAGAEVGSGVSASIGEGAVGPLSAEFVPAATPAWAAPAGTEAIMAEKGLLSATSGLSSPTVSTSAAPVAGGASASATPPPAPTPAAPPVNQTMLDQYKALRDVAQADSSAKIYAGVGQGLASGVGEVGKTMMQSSAAEDLRKQKLQDDIDRMRLTGDIPQINIPTITGITQSSRPAYNTSAAAQAPAPSANVSQALSSQTQNADVSKQYNQQMAAMTQSAGNISDWWLSHLQPLDTLAQSRRGNSPTQPAAAGV